VANIAEGFTAVQGEQLTRESIQELDPVQAFIGLSATGLVSLIVLALAEILGTDVETAVKQAEREHKRQPGRSVAQTEISVQPGSANSSKTAEFNSIERARAAKAEKDAVSNTEAMNILLRFVDDNPDASLSAIGQYINRSKTTVSNYVRALEQDGRLIRNGEGWQVLS
jgi:uncharacterized membrane protein YcjF (UPF0283 family)